MNNLCVESFLNKVRSDCQAYGITLLLEPSTYILTNNIPVSGYFSEAEGVLRVAIDKPQNEWLAILAHEYGHLLQYIEQCYEYRQIQYNGQNIILKFDQWLNKEIELSDNDKTEIFNRLFNFERDCEARAINLIKKYNLPINLEDYTQKANSYLLLYPTIKITRVWPEYKDLPYNNKKVYSLMPNNSLILVPNMSLMECA